MLPAALVHPEMQVSAMSDSYIIEVRSEPAGIVPPEDLPILDDSAWRSPVVVDLFRKHVPKDLKIIREAKSAGRRY